MDAHTFLRGASIVLTGSTVISKEAADDYMHRSLQVDSQGNPLVENEPTRIGDIGVGTLVFLIINIAYIGLCCFGSMINSPGCLYFWGTFFYTIVMIFLFEATRTSRWVTEEEVLSETDPYFNSRLFLMLFFIWCSCWTCCFWTYWHLTPSVVGKVPENAAEENGFIKPRPMF
jgi:hypothetical protein